MNHSIDQSLTTYKSPKLVGVRTRSQDGLNADRDKEHGFGVTPWILSVSLFV